MSGTSAYFVPTASGLCTSHVKAWSFILTASVDWSQSDLSSPHYDLQLLQITMLIMYVEIIYVLNEYSRNRVLCLRTLKGLRRCKVSFSANNFLLCHRVYHFFFLAVSGLSKGWVPIHQLCSCAASRQGWGCGQSTPWLHWVYTFQQKSRCRIVLPLFWVFTWVRSWNNATVDLRSTPRCTRLFMALAITVHL